MTKVVQSSISLVADTSASSEYRLLELPPEIAALIEDSTAGQSADGKGAAVDAIRIGGKRKRNDENGNGDERQMEWDEAQRILTINGRYMDDAVVCTSSRTYSLRQVSQSNSLLLCSLLPRSSVQIHDDQHEQLEPPSSSDSGLSMALQRSQPRSHLQQQQTQAQAGKEQLSVSGEDGKEMVLSLKSMVKNTLELQWTSPKLDRIASLLKDSMYAGPDEEKRRARKAQPGSAEDKTSPQPSPVRLYTMREVRSIVQSSPSELRHGLSRYRVVKLAGKARMVEPKYLCMLLKALITHLDFHAYFHGSVPEEDVLHSLLEEHDVPLEVGGMVLRRWFGRRTNVGADAQPEEAVDGEEEDEEEEQAEEEPSATADDSVETIRQRDGKGKGKAHEIQLDMPEIAKAFGMELLSAMAKEEPVRLDAFIAQWRQELGDTAAEFAHMDLLKGEHLIHPAPPARPTSALPLKVQHFPRSTLPLDASARFQELFLTRSQWLLDDLLPFVEDLAVDKNRRDALLLKFCRTSMAKVAPLSSTVSQQQSQRGRSKTPGAGQKQETVMLYSSRLRC